MRLQGNLPCFDKKGQQAVTKLFTHLQDARNHMAKVVKVIVNVSQVSSPEQLLLFYNLQSDQSFSKKSLHIYQHQQNLDLKKKDLPLKKLQKKIAAI